MEKEVKIALITGIVALLVGLLQYGPALLDLIFSPSPDPEVNVTTIEVPVNTPPEILSLDSDKISPQPEGISIMWTASANDKDDDRLFYKFLLRGPGKNFKIVQDWDTEDTWTWTTTNEDIGVNSVQVQVRDSNHQPENSYDDKTNKSYTILSRPKAVFTSSQLTPGGTVEFDASESRDESGPIILYEWDFGDGNTFSEDKGHATATNQYKNGGVYNVRLTVTNNERVKNSSSIDVNVTSTTSYQIRVKTKNVKGANSDKASVYLTLYGKNGEVKTEKLDNENKNDFERNATDVFYSGELLDVGDIIKITLDVSGSVGGDPWLPEWIEITNEKTEESWTFDNIAEVDEAKIYGSYYPR